MPRGISGRACCCFKPALDFEDRPLKLAPFARLAARSPDPLGEQPQVRRCRGEERAASAKGRRWPLRELLPCRDRPTLVYMLGLAARRTAVRERAAAFLLASYGLLRFRQFASKIRRRAGGRARRRPPSARRSTRWARGMRTARRRRSRWTCSRRVGARPRRTKIEGWTTVESAVSALVKVSNDSSWARFVREQGAGDGGVRRLLHPEALAAKLARKVFTNGKRPRDGRRDLRAHARRRVWRARGSSFRTAAGATRRWWQRCCRSRGRDALDLSGNTRIGYYGYCALAEAIEAGGRRGSAESFRGPAPAGEACEARD